MRYASNKIDTDDRARSLKITLTSCIGWTTTLTHVYNHSVSTFVLPSSARKVWTSNVLAYSLLHLLLQMPSHNLNGKQKAEAAIQRLLFFKNHQFLSQSFSQISKIKMAASVLSFYWIIS